MAHGLRRASGKWASSGQGARSRRREKRWQFDDYGNPVVQRIFNASSPPPKHRHNEPRQPRLGVSGSSEYVHRRDVNGRSLWEPASDFLEPAHSQLSHRPTINATATDAIAM